MGKPLHVPAPRKATDIWRVAQATQSVARPWCSAVGAKSNRAEIPARQDSVLCAAAAPRMTRILDVHGRLAANYYRTISNCCGGRSARSRLGANPARSDLVFGTVSDCRNRSTSAASPPRPCPSRTAPVFSQSCCTVSAVSNMRPPLARVAEADAGSATRDARSHSTRESPRCADR